MTKWIESPEGITVILRHGAEVAQAYQHTLESQSQISEFEEWHRMYIKWERIRQLIRKYTDITDINKK